MAGGTTPAATWWPVCRSDVFVADAALTAAQPCVHAALVVLSLVSIDAGVTYNLHSTRKRVTWSQTASRLRPNLLFPAVTRDGWKTLPWAVTIVGPGHPCSRAFSWQASGRVGGQPGATPPSRRIRSMVHPTERSLHRRRVRDSRRCGTVVSAARVSSVRADFMPTPADVRDRALESFRQQGRCTACAARGREANPVEVIGFETTALSLDLAPAPGPGLSYRLRAVAARARRNAGWGSLSVDFGDASSRETAGCSGNASSITLSDSRDVRREDVVRFRRGVRFDDERLLNVRGAGEPGRRRRWQHQRLPPPEGQPPDGNDNGCAGWGEVSTCVTTPDRWSTRRSG